VSRSDPPHPDPVPGVDALPETAAMALALSRRHCTPDCTCYHGVWGFLRLYGLLPSVAKDHAFLLDALGAVADAGGRRILVSGTADHGILSYVLHVFERRGMIPEVTVVDLCPTPLAVNAWYAERQGLAIATAAGDVFAFAGGPFDAIVAHNFLNFFAPEDRCRLVAHWRELLSEGGRIVSVSTIRPDAPARSRRFEADAAERLAERMASAHAASAHGALVDAGTLNRLVLDYAERRAPWNIVSIEELRRPFEAAGLATRLTPSGVQVGQDLTSIPHKARYGVVATR
jgi:SAM-dependent methyltransferase